MALSEAIKNNPIYLVGAAFVAGAGMAWGVANAILVSPRNDDIERLSVSLDDAHREIHALRDRQNQLEEQRDHFRQEVAAAAALAANDDLVREFEGIFKILPEEFELKVLQSPKPVVLLFPESWDGNSLRLAHTYLKIYSEYRGRVKFLWCEIRDMPKKAAEFEILAVPTMLMFKNGELVDRLVGNLGEEKTREFIDKNLRG